MGKIFHLVKRPVTACIQPTDMRLFLEGEPVFERETQTSSRLDPKNKHERRIGTVFYGLPEQKGRLTMNVAIIGCGKVADAHAEIITASPAAPSLQYAIAKNWWARQMHERYKTKHWFTDVDKLLQEAKPNVVHITTPPQSHYSLVKFALRPDAIFTLKSRSRLTPRKRKRLITLGTKKNLKITVGTNIQYSHVSIRVRDMVKKRFFLAPADPYESIFCYSLKTTSRKRF